MERLPNDEKVSIEHALKYAKVACQRSGGHIAVANEVMRLWLAEKPLRSSFSEDNSVFTHSQQILGKTRSGKRAVLYFHGSEEYLGTHTRLNPNSEHWNGHDFDSGAVVLSELEINLFQSLVGELETWDFPRGSKVLLVDDIPEDFAPDGPYAIVVPIPSQDLNLNQFPSSKPQQLSVLEINPFFIGMMGGPANARQIICDASNAGYKALRCAHWLEDDLRSRNDYLMRFVCVGSERDGNGAPLSYVNIHWTNVVDPGKVAQFVGIAPSETSVGCKESPGKIRG